MEPAQQPIVEHVGPTDYMATIPLEIVCMIMPMLQLWQQVALRRVSRGWKTRVEEWFSFITNPEKPLYHSLNINVKKVREIELNAEILPSNRKRITICGSAFNSDAVLVIGCIFRQIRQLVIYWDNDDSQENIDSLVVLVKQFRSLTSFAMIVPGKMGDSKALAKISSMRKVGGFETS